MATYNYNGITTNNLKDISVEFNDNEIIYIGGASGSGKSSLAFDTIASISENEYGCLVRDNKTSVNYRIKEYGTVLVAATLKQLNFNVNPRSIIMTYFGLYTHISNILAQCTDLTADNFSLNGPSRCLNCNGLGYVDDVDEALIVAPDKILSDGPFRCWNNSYSDYFSQLLHYFCKEVGIDESRKFYDLTKQQQELLLRSKGTTKYQITFRVGGKIRRKTSVYIGPVLALSSSKTEMFGNSKGKYSMPHICPVCNGSRLTNIINQKEVINGTTVSFILTANMNEVEKILNKIKLKIKTPSITYSCDHVLRFIDACKKLNVSHLNFSRAISTLSGGELQRLRIAQLLLGRLKNLIIILDEPTSSLDWKEADSIIKIVQELSKNNTVIVVDHNEKLRKISNRAFFLGPESGINGGYLISESEYAKTQKDATVHKRIPIGKALVIPLMSEYVKYRDKLTIYENALNGICGCSGVGKTTILRDILPYQLDNYQYISQKPIKAGRNSTVASFSGLLDEIREFYSYRTKTEKKYFSLSQRGACSKCGGIGSILIGNYYDEKLFIDCEQCNATGYARKTLSYEVDGMNIYCFLEQSIGEILSKNIHISKKFDNTIKLLANLGLGHLVLNQKTNTLSGGENQRLKLSQAFGERKIKSFGLDEPSKGLGQKEISNLIRVLYDTIEHFGKTFVVSEHNEFFLKMCSCVSELVMTNKVVCIKTPNSSFQQ